MIGINMEMPKGCWDCKLRYGHFETKCIFTHISYDDVYYSDKRSSNCPLIDLTDKTDMRGDNK